MCLALLSFWYHRSTKKEVKGKKKSKRLFWGWGRGERECTELSSMAFPSPLLRPCRRLQPVTARRRSSFFVLLQSHVGREKRSVRRRAVVAVRPKH